MRSVGILNGVCQERKADIKMSAKTITLIVLIAIFIFLVAIDGRRK